MPGRDYFLLFVSRLNRLGVRYMISGSIGAMFYGEPRFTQDVDFVVSLNDKDISGLADVFQQPEFYLPPMETLLAEIRREQRGHFNVIHCETGFKADMYLTGRDELNAWGFRFKRTVQYEGETVILAPPEYIIVLKLEYYREGLSEKHLRDIRSMLAVSGGQLDQAGLSHWIKRRGLETEWALVSN